MVLFWGETKSLQYLALSWNFWSCFFWEVVPFLLLLFLWCSLSTCFFQNKPQKPGIKPVKHSPYQELSPKSSSVQVAFQVGRLLRGWLLCDQPLRHCPRFSSQRLAIGVEFSKERLRLQRRGCFVGMWPRLPDGVMGCSCCLTN